MLINRNVCKQAVPTPQPTQPYFTIKSRLKVHYVDVKIETISRAAVRANLPAEKDVVPGEDEMGKEGGMDGLAEVLEQVQQDEAQEEDVTHRQRHQTLHHV